MTDDSFSLVNDPDPSPLPKKDGQPDPKAKQLVLFAGMDCLPGQLDLFDTDGVE
jgi:hypothetical protein